MKKIVSVMLALFTVFNVSSYCNNFICSASEVTTTTEFNRQRIVLDLSNDSDINFVVKDKTQKKNSKLGSAIKKVIGYTALIFSGIVTGKILCKTSTKFSSFDSAIDNKLNDGINLIKTLNSTKILDSLKTSNSTFYNFLQSQFQNDAQSSNSTNWFRPIKAMFPSFYNNTKSYFENAKSTNQNETTDTTGETTNSTTEQQVEETKSDKEQ